MVVLVLVLDDCHPPSFPLAWMPWEDRSKVSQQTRHLSVLPPFAVLLALPFWKVVYFVNTRRTEKRETRKF